ncbi:MAG: MMPL family transporter [Catonella sp.]|nr:MMPL family transporter [Catonella sp.]MDY6356854.1 MMPL family transporter [Catonella sp.]
MIKFGKAVVKARIPILIISLLLLIPSFFGYVGTRVNYDVLTYLPKDIETMKGQDILEDEFGSGAFSMLVVENMPDKDVSALREKIEKVDHVKSAIWYDSLMDISIPKEMLPNEFYSKFNSGDATMMMIIFDDTTSSDGTMAAIKEIRSIAGKQCFVSGMSSVVVDTKDLTEQEEPIYVAIAVILSIIVLSLTMDSFLVPFLFLINIGMAIFYNLGTNIFFGEISYITKALAAVLQLGVTMDYSIFLWNSFKENQERFPGDDKRAMAHAISNTLQSVIGSSVTTIAGFLALCFMSFTLGLDIGLVMAKGVLFGVISCVTILPALVLAFEKPLMRTRHKALLPDIKGIGNFLSKHYITFIVLLVALFIPFAYAQAHTKVYYNLGDTLPKNLPSIVANQKLEDEMGMSTTEMILVDKNTDTKTIRKMCDEIEDTDGVEWVLGLDSVVGPAIPDEMIDDDLRSDLESDNWKLILLGSKYAVATDEVNNQITTLNKIIKGYDKKAMLIGEAPCTKDLITVTNHDFNAVNIASVGLIFIIIAFVFKSISLPFLLVIVIECAIFINMGIPYFTGTSLPFVASIVIGTIQLGSTVDYAILMTTRYQKERHKGADKHEAVSIASQTSTKSIMISGLSFFAATFGVGLYSKIAIINSMCILMARGAIISMAMVIFVLPSVLILFDPLIIRTSKGFKPENGVAASDTKTTTAN